MKTKTLKVLWTLIEVAASIRAMLATWTVVYSISNDFAFTAFTVVVVELAFLVALLSIGSDATAPVAAFLALAFSGAMQYLEIVALEGALSQNDKTILRAVVAFAPIVILGLSFVRRLVGEVDVAEVVSKLRGATSAGPVETQTKHVTANGGRARTCSECGDTFETTNAKRVTCSDACRVARSRRLSKP